ncbi:hypothetical protein [Bacillus sp. P14.5]|uniref:hypothetical protein n=1 Tax=Bacillus sp. P14.5 TaxID=1983400 RepID=UPI000DEB9A00|nr:hypothetical protein [Bacillus sp. P14.5]
MEKVIRKAYHNHTPLEIIYKTDEDVFSKRTIYILKTEKESLTAYCYLRNQIRTFNMENILAAFPADRVPRPSLLNKYESSKKHQNNRTQTF